MEASEVQAVLEANYEARGETRWYDHPGNLLLEQIEYLREPKVISGLGRLRLVEQFGGEGQGDRVWFVFQLENGQMFRIDGYHSSYDGSYYDGDVYEVKPQLVQVTEYVKA